MTKGEVSELVAVLMFCYPNARFPDGTVVAYENFLQELDVERARLAVAHLAKTSKFMPSIAEVFAAYEALAPRGPRALREWIPDPSPGDYRPHESAGSAAGAAVAGLLGKAAK